MLDETGASARRGHAPLPSPSSGNEPGCGFVEEAEEIGEVGGEWGRGAGEMDRCEHCGAGGRYSCYTVTQGLGKLSIVLRIFFIFRGQQGCYW